MTLKKIIGLIVLVKIITTVYSQSQQIVINEFLAYNSSINIDSDFNSSSDWIELYNPQTYTVD